MHKSNVIDIFIAVAFASQRQTLSFIPHQELKSQKRKNILSDH